MESRVRTALLYDFYGSLLTKRQQGFMELYFGEDLSLGRLPGSLALAVKQFTILLIVPKQL